MAKKKQELSSESISVSRFGTGYTVSASRFYKGSGKGFYFREVYTDRIELIEGLAKYLGLETTHRDRLYVPGVDRDVLCVLYPKPEKVA